MTSEFDINAAQLRRRLKKWYAKHARELPWRETANPYHIWISEIMLQQTTVKAVVPYFERFIARFPDIETLSKCSEEEVLQYWEGLGYYSRGRNILKTARVIESQYGGEFPSDLQQLTELPGIGRYTAGAIRSFGFNLPAPIVEANTLRLYARLTGYTESPQTSSGQKYLWSFAEFIQPARVAGTLNQSLMELGSLVCTPTAPVCHECPLNSQCHAFAEGRQNEIPQKKPRVAITPVLEATIAIQQGDKFLIRQRSVEERWAGLWDFLRFEIAGVDTEVVLHSTGFKKISAVVAKHVSGLCQIQVSVPEFRLQIRHSVTRYRIRLMCYHGVLETPLNQPLLPGFRWVTLDELSEFPMPVSGRKYAKFLQDNES